MRRIVVSWRLAWASAVVAGLLTALCLALPTHNATGDAWYYAACARWGHELAQPHHLLYNYSGWLWLRLVGATGPAPAGLAALGWLQALNALAAGGSLLALGGLLRRAGVGAPAVPAWLLLVGSTFGMLRFATENEAYIQPLLLALLASLAWARALASRTARRAGWWLLAAGTLAALACLVHQLLLWWWLGLLLGLRPWRSRAALGAALLYLGPALLVPLTYALALVAQGQPLGLASVLRFALHDYLTGGARVEIGLKSLLLTGISLVRTLAQVHGNMLPLLRRWPVLLGAVGLGSLALGGYALGGRPRPAGPLAAAPSPARTVRRTHGLIGLLHLGFAVQASGNAEFMVMLPALAALALAGRALAAWAPRRIAALGVALLSWNLAFGLVPAHVLEYAGAAPALRARVLAEPTAWFLLQDHNTLLNQLHYYTGRPVGPPGVAGAPALWAQRPGQSRARFRAWLATRLAAGATVYTDALGGYQPLDRAHLVLGHDNASLLKSFRQVRVDSFPTFSGPRYLTRLALPPPPSPPKK